jgi:hypothetical protein
LTSSRSEVPLSWFHFMWYVAWGMVVGVFVVGVLLWRSGKKRWRRLYTAVGILAAVYIVLDII